MSKNWSKIVLVSVLVLMVAASMSFATTARVRSLAYTGDYMSDDSNAMRWYSVLPMYANQVNAELGTLGNAEPDGLPFVYFLDGTRALSVNYACGEDGKWGTYRISLNENTLDSPGLWSTNMMFMTMLPGMAPTGLSGTTTPLNKWDFAGGWELGENASVGVSVTRSSWNYEDPDNSANQSFTSVGVGGTWSNNDGMALDGTFTWGVANGDANFSTNPLAGTDPYTVEFDSKNAIEIAGRMFWDWKDDVTVVPVASFANSDYSLKDNQDPSNVGGPGTGDKMKDFKVGVGLNMDVNTSNMLIVAGEFRYMKWEYSNSDTTSGTLAEISSRYLPTIRMALETRVTSWMTTRIGAAKHLGELKLTSTDGEEVKVEPGTPAYFYPDLSSFDWTLGVGFDVAEWTVDLELDSAAPFSTFYWITGYSYYDTDSSYGPVTRISALYNF